MPHFAHKIPKLFRRCNPRTPVDGGGAPSCTHPQERPSSLPQFDPHFEIPSVVYGGKSFPRKHAWLKH